MAKRTLRIEISEHGAKVVSDKIRGIGTSAATASKDMLSLQNVLRGIAVYLSARQIIAYADAWTLLGNRIRVLTTDVNQFNRTQNELVRISVETRTGLQQTAEVYQRIATNAKVLGASAGDTFQVLEAINQSLTISGANARSAELALIQLGQAFGSDALRGQELRSVLEQTPRLAKAIADDLGVHVGQLIKLGESGELSARRVFEAIKNQSEVLQEEFQKTTPTVEQAFSVLVTKVTEYIGKTNEALGITKGIASAMIFLANNLDIVVGIFVVLGATIVAINLNAILGLIVSGLFSMSGALTTATTAILAFDAAALSTTLSLIAFNIGGVVIAIKALTVAVLTSPLLPFVLGVIALTAALISLKRVFDAVTEARNKFFSFFDSIRSKIISFIPTIDGFKKKWSQMFALTPEMEKDIVGIDKIIASSIQKRKDLTKELRPNSIGVIVTEGIDNQKDILKDLIPTLLQIKKIISDPGSGIVQDILLMRKAFILVSNTIESSILQQIITLKKIFENIGGTVKQSFSITSRAVLGIASVFVGSVSYMIGVLKNQLQISAFLKEEMQNQEQVVLDSLKKQEQNLLGTANRIAALRLNGIQRGLELIKQQNASDLNELDQFYGEQIKQIEELEKKRRSNILFYFLSLLVTPPSKKPKALRNELSEQTADNRIALEQKFQSERDALVRENNKRIEDENKRHFETLKSDIENFNRDVRSIRDRMELIGVSGLSAEIITSRQAMDNALDDEKSVLDRRIQIAEDFYRDKASLSFHREEEINGIIDRSKERSQLIEDNYQKDVNQAIEDAYRERVGIVSRGEEQLFSMLIDFNRRTFFEQTKGYQGDLEQNALAREDALLKAQQSYDDSFNKLKQQYTDTPANVRDQSSDFSEGRDALTQSLQQAVAAINTFYDAAHASILKKQSEFFDKQMMGAVDSTTKMQQEVGMLRLDGIDREFAENAFRLENLKQQEEQKRKEIASSVDLNEEQKRLLIENSHRNVVLGQQQYDATLIALQKKASDDALKLIDSQTKKQQDLFDKQLQDAIDSTTKMQQKAGVARLSGIDREFAEIYFHLQNVIREQERAQDEITKNTGYTEAEKLLLIEQSHLSIAAAQQQFNAEQIELQKKAADDALKAMKEETDKIQQEYIRRLESLQDSVQSRFNPTADFNETTADLQTLLGGLEKDELGSQLKISAREFELAYTEAFVRLLEQSREWSSGMILAFKDIRDFAGDAASNTREVWTKTFSTLEDELTNFLTEGEFNFKNFVKGIISEVNRLIVRQNVIAPLSGYLLNQTQSGGLDFLKGLFGGGGTNTTTFQPGQFKIPSFDSGGVNMKAGIFHAGVPEVHIPLSQFERSISNIMSSSTTNNDNRSVTVKIDARSESRTRRTGSLTRTQTQESAAAARSIARASRRNRIGVT